MVLPQDPSTDRPRPILAGPAESAKGAGQERARVARDAALQHLNDRRPDILAGRGCGRGCDEGGAETTRYCVFKTTKQNIY